jgi:transcriptional regulator with GAF, ATPase, and Fis domain
MRPECPDQALCLHLVASAGTSERIDGAFRRFPIGAREVGMAVVRLRPYVARGGLASRSLAEATWLASHRVRSFVAVPLVRDGVSIGVLALFSRRELTDAEVGLITFAADQALAAHAKEGREVGARTRGTDAQPPQAAPPSRAALEPSAMPPVERTLAEIEREAIERTLAHTSGRISGPRGAAAILGLHPNTLASRMLKLGIKRPRG